VYLETQAALSLPGEGGSLKVVSATQGPTGVQKAVARVLGLPMHLVEWRPEAGRGFGQGDQVTPGLPGRASRLPAGRSSSCCSGRRTCA
jgi:xanthine dehydrogenase large subunit